MPCRCVVDGWELNLRIDRVDELQDGSRLLIDYKSGAPERMRLDDANARPIQLAAYVAATGWHRVARADAVALLSLSPRHKDMRLQRPGQGCRCCLPARCRQQQGWEQLASSWQQQIQQLVHDHVNGHAGGGAIARCLRLLPPRFAVPHHGSSAGSG